MWGCIAFAICACNCCFGVIRKLFPSDGGTSPLTEAWSETFLFLSAFSFSPRNVHRLQATRIEMTMMTKSNNKFSLRSLSTFFSWHKQRQVAPRPLLELELESADKDATELTHFEEDNHHHLSYTSLRDLMPSSRPISPIKRKRESLTGEREEAEEDDLLWAGASRPPIKNRLVEQAARAYLLPSGAHRTPPNQFFARYWAKLTNRSFQSHQSTEDLRVPTGGCIHGCNNGCLSCLPSLLWVDLTRAFRTLFSHLRPQSISFLRV